MDLDNNRPHFRTTSIGTSTTATTSELFICFTSRLSSSSMRLTKSILSPGRAARDGGAPVSLSSSLSRRLRSNGSLKGGASPFFTTTAKKRGCGYENPEPSSPKVTCIGQVRVKTKKKVKQTRSLSRRRSGEASFRKIEQGGSSSISSSSNVENEDKGQRYSNASAHYHNQQQQEHRNQRWVHLPVSICEALRSFGAEFSCCLFPCKSSCFSKVEKHGSGCSENESGCGAVFGRWVVCVNDGEGGKRREIEVVVEEEEEEEEEARVSMRSSRRHVFDDIEVKDGNRIEVKGQGVDMEGEEEGGRVSICIPPKNALLLMRCRSDPMKMADLAHRFSWDAGVNNANAVNKNEIIREEIICEGDEDFEEQIRRCEGKYEQDVVKDNVEQGEQLVRNEEEVETEIRDNEQLVVGSEEIVEGNEGEELENEIEANEEALMVEKEEEEIESNMDSFEALLDQSKYDEEDCTSQQKEQVEVEEENAINPNLSSSPEEEDDDVIECNEFVDNYAENQVAKIEPETSDREEEREQGVEMKLPEIEKPGNQEFSDEKPEKENQVLPDCLLLMMCEPKLSMEVSKETWVCSTDFIRWLPERPRKPGKGAKPGGCDHEPVKRRLSTDSKPKQVTDQAPAAQNNVQVKQKQRQHLQQPPRSSCSAASMAAVIEQKLVNAVGYEPFGLTRCKSEPMRTAAPKLVPESCCWNNAVRKMEPHRQATVGVGAAGVGF